MDLSWTHFAAVASARHCKRAFLDRPVPRELLEQVLTVAANAPSTRNGQPWRVAVVSDAARDALAARLCADFDCGVVPKPDYPNRPVLLEPVMEERAREAGIGVLAAKGIERFDRAARQAHLRANMEFYGAPTVMIFHLEAKAPPGAFLEMGFFVQNVMLGLVASGLGGCPQYSVASYPDTLRDQLALGDRLVVCSLAVGYPDPDVPVNAWYPARAELAEYTQWHDQPPSAC